MRLFTTGWLISSAVAALARLPMQKRAVVPRPSEGVQLLDGQKPSFWSSPLLLLALYFSISLSVLYALVLVQRKLRLRRKTKHAGPLELPGSEVELLPTVLSPVLERDVILPLSRSAMSPELPSAPSTPFTPPTSPRLARPISPFAVTSNYHSKASMRPHERTASILSLSGRQEDSYLALQRSKSTPPVPRSRVQDIHLRRFRSHSRSGSDLSSISSSSSSGVELFSMSPLTISKSSPLPCIPMFENGALSGSSVVLQKSRSPTDLIDFSTPELPAAVKAVFGDPLGVSFLPAPRSMERSDRSSKSSGSIDLADMGPATTSLPTAPVLEHLPDTPTFVKQLKSKPSLPSDIQSDLSRQPLLPISSNSSTSSSASSSPTSAQFLYIPPTSQSTPGTTPLLDEFVVEEYRLYDESPSSVVLDEERQSLQQYPNEPQVPFAEASALSLSDLITWDDDNPATRASPSVSDAVLIEGDSGVGRGRSSLPTHLGKTTDSGMADDIKLLIDFSVSLACEEKSLQKSEVFSGSAGFEAHLQQDRNSEVDPSFSDNYNGDPLEHHRTPDAVLIGEDFILLGDEALEAPMKVNEAQDVPAGHTSLRQHSDISEAVEEILPPYVQKPAGGNSYSEIQLQLDSLPDLLVSDVVVDSQVHVLNNASEAASPLLSKEPMTPLAHQEPDTYLEIRPNDTLDDNHDNEQHNDEIASHARHDTINDIHDSHDLDSLSTGFDSDNAGVAADRHNDTTSTLSLEIQENDGERTYSDPDLLPLPTFDFKTGDAPVPPIIIAETSSPAVLSALLSAPITVVTQLDIERPLSSLQAPRTEVLQTPTPPSSPPPSPSTLLDSTSSKQPSERPAWAVRAADAPPLGLESAALPAYRKEDWKGLKLEKLAEMKPKLEASQGSSKLEVNTTPPSTLPKEGAKLPEVEALKDATGEIPGSFVEPSVLRSRSNITPSGSDEVVKAETTVNRPAPDPRRRQRSPLDIALAMQLRPGLGIGADPAWLVRFLMSMFGWFAVLISGSGEWEPVGALVGR